MTDSVSYVANIKVEKVLRKENQDRHSASSGSISRDVIETINLTIKSGSLTTLKEKIAAHVSILDEEDL